MGIDELLLRNEWGRILVVALASQGYVGDDREAIGLALLREVEAQGATLRWMSDDERAAKSRGEREDRHRHRSETYMGEPVPGPGFCVECQQTWPCTP